MIKNILKLIQFRKLKVVIDKENTDIIKFYECNRDLFIKRRPIYGRFYDSVFSIRLICTNRLNIVGRGYTFSV